MGKIQTNLKGELMARFKRFMELTGQKSEYQAAHDLLVRGLLDFERERLEERVKGVRGSVGAEVSGVREEPERDWRTVFKPEPSVKPRGG